MRWIVFGILLCIGAVRAAAPVDKPPEMLDLPHQVERLADGKPIPVVVVADNATGVITTAPDTAGEGLLEALQNMSAAYSDEPTAVGTPEILREDVERGRTVYQPFAFDAAHGRVWTIATDRTWVEKPVNASPPPMPPLVAGQTFFYSLSRAQLDKATHVGLAWKDFTDRQQALLRVVFQRPWAVVRMVPGKDQRLPVEVASSRAPLPVEKCVLHLYFGFTYLETPGSESGRRDTYRLFPDDLLRRMGNDDMQWFSEVVPRDTRNLKPSDLDYDRPELRRAIGVSGVTTVGAVVEAAAKASGLPLRADARYAKRAAFVGDGALRSGDALKALTFAMDATWRKVGDVYLLTWDRQGLAARALEQRERKWSENGRDAEYARWMAKARALRPPRWLSMLESTLKPDPAAPVAPTPQQIAAVNAPPSPEEQEQMSASDFSFGLVRDREKVVYSWSHLTTDQRNAVQNIFGGREAKDGKGPFPMQNLDDSRLRNPDIRVAMDISGVGAVNADLVLPLVYWLSRMEFDGQRERERTKAEDAVKREAMLARPLKLIHSVRAVMAPPLPQGEWPRLLDQMQRKGLNTLYLPVLWDGMTLQPGADFPQLPLSYGSDALADVLKAAKSRDIRVMAVLHTLAWRLPQSESHWLSKYPGLVDTDAMGRTRRAWRHDVSPLDPVIYGASGEFLRRDAFATADYVRPNAPAVRSRLLGLIAELRHYKDISGVALANWSRFTAPVPDANPFGGADAAPSLGYALNERAAFLAENEVDPLDIASDDFPDRDGGWPELPLDGYDDKWNAFRHAEDLRLAQALLAAIEKGWPGRAELFDFLEPSDALPLPSADVTITWVPVSGIKGATYRRVSIPSTAEPPYPDSDTPPPTPEEVRKQRLDAFNLALHKAAASAHGSGIFKADGVVLDFTASPDLMWEALKLLPDAAR